MIAEPVGGRAQPTVNFDCQSSRTMRAESETSKSAGGEHVPPAGGLGELIPQRRQPAGSSSTTSSSSVPSTSWRRSR